MPTLEKDPALLHYYYLCFQFSHTCYTKQSSDLAIQVQFCVPSPIQHILSLVFQQLPFVRFLASPLRYINEFCLTQGNGLSRTLYIQMSNSNYISCHLIALLINMFGTRDC